MEDQRFVECCIHGKQVATFVCQHIVQTLRDNVPRGFWSAVAESGELYPDSWCSECEAMINAIGEWNDETESKAGVSMVCSACYDLAKAINQGAGASNAF